MSNLMSFDQAIEAMKQGKSVRRVDWEETDFVKYDKYNNVYETFENNFPIYKVSLCFFENNYINKTTNWVLVIESSHEEFKYYPFKNAFDKAFK